MDTFTCNNCIGSDLKTLVREVHQRIDKSNSIIIFNVSEELINNLCSPFNLAETIFKALGLNIYPYCTYYSIGYYV